MQKGVPNLRIFQNQILFLKKQVSVLWKCLRFELLSYSFSNKTHRLQMQGLKSSGQHQVDLMTPLGDKADAITFGAI